MSHKKRPRFSGRAAVHVVLRFGARVDLGAVRVRAAIEDALQEGRGRLGLHIAEVRSRENELHLLAEAKGTNALSRGMQGLSIRIAKGINRALGAHGRIFADHFEAFVLRSADEIAGARERTRAWQLDDTSVSQPRLRYFGAAAG